MRDFIKKYDIFTKFVAVFIAVVLWVYVMGEKNPIRTATFNDLTLEYTSTNVILSNYDLIVVSEEFPKVDIKVRGLNDELSKISPSNIKIEADLASINEPGEYTVDYRVRLPYSNIEVIDKYPSKITVTVDEMKIREVPIFAELTGTPKDGYLYETPDISQKLIITGPADELKEVSTAYIKIDTTDNDKNILGEYQIFLLDKDGNTITSDHISGDKETVSVSIPVNKLKDVSFTVEVLYADGFDKERFNGYSVNVSSAKVYGKPDYIDGLLNINIGTVTIDNDTTADTEFKFNLPQSTDYKYLNNTISNLVVKVDLIEDTFKSFTVTDFNLNEISGNDVTIPRQTVSVTIKGKPADLALVTADNIEVIPVFDSSGLVSGEYTAKCKVNVIDTDKQFEVTNEVTIKVEVN